MRSAVVLGDASVAEALDDPAVEVADLGDRHVACALLDDEPAPFEPRGAHRRHVLVRKLAFSCNYRDRVLLATMSARAQDDGYFPFGSEFVGEVVDVGADVHDLRSGARVVADCSYPAGVDGAPAGIPTNTASQAAQVFHRGKLFVVDEAMPVADAAAFSLGAQTAWGIVRRLALRPGARVLVTAATCSTSLFVLQALRGLDVQVDALTTSAARASTAPALAGVDELVVVARDPEADGDEALRRLARKRGGWDAVIDPFVDRYLPRTLPLLAMDGRYVTCGLADSSPGAASRGPAIGPPVWAALVAHRIALLGHCLGEPEDLRAAWAAYQRGDLRVPIDTVFHGERLAAFVERSFAAADRVGRVVFRYE